MSCINQPPPQKEKRKKDRTTKWDAEFLTFQSPDASRLREDTATPTNMDDNVIIKTQLIINYLLYDFHLRTKLNTKRLEKPLDRLLSFDC